MIKKYSSFLGKLALFAATVIWGSSFFIMKNTVEHIPSNLLLAIRFTFGFFALSLIFAVKWKKADAYYLKWGSLAGVVLYTAYLMQTLGLTDPVHTPGKNAFLTAVYCVIVPFLFWIFNKKRPSVFNIAAAFVCILGIWLIAVEGEGTVGWGDLLTLVGGLMYAFHIIIISNCSKSKDIILITIIQFGAAAVCSWTMSFIQGNVSAITSVNRGDLLSLGYLALFCTTIALLLQNVGQKYVPPASASIILSLESVFGALFSIIFYHEKLSAKKALGFIIIFAAIMISEALPELRKSKKS